MMNPPGDTSLGGTNEMNDTSDVKFTPMRSHVRLTRNNKRNGAKPAQ